MKNLLLIGIVSFVTACGGGSDAPAPVVVDPCAPLAHEAGFIQWIGSANGDFVVDSDNEFARFDIATRWMELNGFFYPAVAVDLASDLYEDFDGDGNYNYAGGGVYKVVSVDGCEIAGAVDDFGFFFDIEEIGVGLIQITTSNKAAVYAKPTANRDGVVEDGDQQLNHGDSTQSKVTVLGTATGTPQ